MYNSMYQPYKAGTKASVCPVRNKDGLCGRLMILYPQYLSTPVPIIYK